MNWTGQVTSSDQGLIIDNETGRTIAVAYDPMHTNLIAAAPKLLKALQFVMTAHGEQLDTAVAQAHAAIEEATGETA
jgi:hypothetical protein